MKATKEYMKEMKNDKQTAKESNKRGPARRDKEVKHRVGRGEWKRN